MDSKTKIISIGAQDSDERLTQLLAPAAEVIRRGGLVAFPTETVYGLGADGTNPDAAAKIYEAKGRPSDNPLIIHISSPEEAEEYAYTNEVYYRIASAFMPGPVTVILKAKPTVPERTRGGLETVALRCPSHPIAKKLISLAGVPIAAPSANISGSPSPTTASHVIDDMMGRADIIIDGGDCDFGLESTIISAHESEGVVLLRPGRITVNDIQALGIEVRVADAVTDRLREGEVALSPGMKYRHYAPSAEVILLDGDGKGRYEYISKIKGKVAVIAYSEEMEPYKALDGVCAYDFGSSEDKLGQAHRLFDILRTADKENYDVIFAPLPSTDGIGLALYNRMIRAAAHKIIKL